MIQDLLSISTIPELIELFKQNPLTHDKLYLKATSLDEASDTIKINFLSILDRYYDYIVGQSIVVTFTDRDWMSYKYQPKRLSMNLYKTTELWSLILRINNMASMLEFNKKTLILPPVQLIFGIINEIMILEQENIDTNTLLTT